MVHTHAAEVSLRLPSPAEVTGFSLLLSVYPSEDIVAGPAGKQKPIGAWPAEKQASQPAWASHGSPGGFPVAGQGVDLLPQQPGGLQDLLPSVPSEALAHEDSCGV